MRSKFDLTENEKNFLVNIVQEVFSFIKENSLKLTEYEERLRSIHKCVTFLEINSESKLNIIRAIADSLKAFDVIQFESFGVQPLQNPYTVSRNHGVELRLTKCLDTNPNYYYIDYLIGY